MSNLLFFVSLSIFLNPIVVSFRNAVGMFICVSKQNILKIEM